MDSNTLRFAFAASALLMSAACRTRAQRSSATDGGLVRKDASVDPCSTIRVSAIAPPAAWDPPLRGPLAAIAPATDALAPRRPVFTFRIPAAATGARIEICEDRGCKKIMITFSAVGSRARPATALPLGRVFWRVVAVHDARVLARSSARTLRIRNRDGGPGGSTRWGIDWNGDGIVDHARIVNGGVEVRVGGPGGLASAPIRLSSPLQNDDFGRAFAAAGDLNGDGNGDLIVGAPGEITGSKKYEMATGAVHVFFGGNDRGVGTVIRVPGAGMLGGSLAATDLNGDGWSDLVLGAPGIPWPLSAPRNAAPPEAIGRVVVMYGKGERLAEPTILFDGATERMIVSGGGDFAGTGLLEVAVRARVHVDERNLAGARECLQRLAVDALDVSQIGGATTVEAVPDLDDDGHDEIVVGDSLIQQSSGGKLQLSATLPHHVAHAVGDFDGDGKFELAIVEEGGIGILDRQSLSAGRPGRHLEAPTARSLTAGDFNGDGFDDLAIDDGVAFSRLEVAYGSSTGLTAPR